MSHPKRLQPVEHQQSDQDIEKKLAEKREQASNDRVREDAIRQSATHRIVFCYLCGKEIRRYLHVDVVSATTNTVPPKSPHEVWGMTHPICEERYKQCVM